MRGRTWADPSFDAFYEQAKVPVGAYVFSRATTVQSAEQEAEKALSLLHGRPVPLGVYLDVEAREQLNAAVEYIQSIEDDITTVSVEDNKLVFRKRGQN